MRVWLVGASSGIGEALAIELARLGATVALSARRAEKLEQIRESLSVGVQPHLSLALDVTHEPSLAQAVEKLSQLWGKIDLTIWLAGDYAAMRSEQFDLVRALAITEINYVSVLKGLNSLLPQLLRQGQGGLVLVSSVAGFRGLPKALAYGPSKAALTNLAEVLYMDLHEKGIGVWIVHPGFVATPLTAGNAFEMPALMQPSEAALALLRGLGSGRFEIHFPRRFTYWLKFARLLPDRIYFKIIKRVTGL